MYQKTALVVDDSPTSQAVLKRLLKDFDYNVVTQKSGEEALQYLQTDLPDVVFLDHIMPGIDGFGVLRQIKANPRTCNIPVVMYTSQNATRYASEAKAIGAIGVLPKQVGNKELASILERVEQATSISHAPNSGEIVIDIDDVDVNETDTATVLEQTEHLTEIELLKQTLHAELDMQRRELLSQQRDLASQLERQLLTQSLQIAHWQQRSQWRSIAAGILILLPLIAAIHFSSKVTQQQQELTQLQATLQHTLQQQQDWQHSNSNMVAASNDRDQSSKADWEDMKFMLETLIATVEAQARAGKKISARKVMEEAEANTDLSIANVNDNNARENTPGSTAEETAEKQ